MVIEFMAPYSETLPVRIMIHGLHVTRLQYPVSFGKIFLCEGLENSQNSIFHSDDFSKVTYCLITSVTNRFAHQLVDPLGLIAE